MEHGTTGSLPSQSNKAFVCMQLCIPGLENRAVLFPPLTHCTQLAPGMLLILCCTLRLLRFTAVPTCSVNQSCKVSVAWCIHIPAWSDTPDVKLDVTVSTSCTKLAQGCKGCAAGYFAAPGARLYPLSHRKSRQPKPLLPVTLVFCAIDGYHEVMAENHVYGELATTQCYNACRQLLKDRNGYECGAEEGTFLAAFSSGTDALQFCVVVSFVSIILGGNPFHAAF